MDKGYYKDLYESTVNSSKVAIHNKNGQGLLPKVIDFQQGEKIASQSTIKMDKGYYKVCRHHT